MHSVEMETEQWLAHSSACYLRSVQKFTFRLVESGDVLHTSTSASSSVLVLQLTSHTVSVTWASIIMAPSVILQLSERFSYSNTLRSQRVRITDFLYTVKNLLTHRRQQKQSKRASCSKNASYALPLSSYSFW